MIRVVMAFIGAALVAFAIGSVFATQFILGNVAAMGMDVTAGVRLHATVHDVMGLATSYLPLVSIAFLIALPVAGQLAKWFPAQRMVLFILAGAVGVVALHLLMKAALGLSGIAATRTVAGLLSQGLAGAVGGYMFYRLRGHKTAPAAADQ